jgi:hypothetical protein
LKEDTTSDEGETSDDDDSDTVEEDDCTDGENAVTNGADGVNGDGNKRENKVHNNKKNKEFKRYARESGNGRAHGRENNVKYRQGAAGSSTSAAAGEEEEADDSSSEGLRGTSSSAAANQKGSGQATASMHVGNKGGTQSVGGTGAGRSGGTTEGMQAGAEKGTGSGKKDNNLKTKSFRVTFPVNQPYSCIVRRNIELASLALQRGQASLLLAYVYFQKGGGKGLG